MTGPTQPVIVPYAPHHRICATSRKPHTCDRRIDRADRRKHAAQRRRRRLERHRRHERWVAAHFDPERDMQTVEKCEANYESGEPGSTAARDINWRMDSGGYEGAFSWLNSTWRTQAGSMGISAARAVEATPYQQVMVFRRFKNVGEWPPLAHCL